ncbi:MAG: PASTA domain-containing protein [Spirochaetes bacterium]|nr:PASTA domain-containing protein [Spirochaetota bacterium]
MNQKVFKRRVIVTGIFIMGIACFFIYRLADLHFSDKISISPKDTFESKRGYIKDKNGNILAVSVEKNSLFVNPKEINNPADLSKNLSRITGLSEKYIQSRINKNRRFVWIKRKIEDNEYVRIKNLNLKGVHFIKEYHRVYPHGELAANIVGFTGIDNNGLEGIEYKFNDVLLPREKPGFFAGEGKTRFKSNIILTIDKYIQYVSEKEIKQAVINSSAVQGAALVLEVKTGKILAFAKYPTFDPNYYYKYSNEDRGNYTIVNSFEPGSTLKILALAAVLEKNSAAIHREYECPGSMVIGDTTIKCTKVHGRVNMTDIIKYSCNVGMMQAIKGITKEDFHDILKRFGLGEATDVELPGESAGILRPVKEWSGLSKYSISIGQEVSVTSVQMAAAFGAIANGGVYNFPTIIERIELGDGTIMQNYSLRTKGKIINSNNATKIIQMMRTVVEGGTGELADFEYYSPAGKTGTGQKSIKGFYSADKHTSSFIGIAPLRNPDICVFVIVDEPKKSVSGGEAAAPAFARIAKKTLVYRGERVSKITATDPINIREKERKFDGASMPDFSGLSMAECIELLIKIQNRHNVKYNISGTGKVYKQNPVAGAKLTGKTEITLYLRAL